MVQPRFSSCRVGRKNSPCIDMMQGLFFCVRDYRFFEPAVGAKVCFGRVKNVRVSIYYLSEL